MRSCRRRFRDSATPAAFRSGCRIAAAGRSSFSTRICRSSSPRAAQASGAGGSRFTVLRRRSADLRRGGSRQGVETGRGRRRRLSDAAGLSRRPLSEPVQPLRPAVARVPAGGRGGAPERRGHPKLLRAEQQGHDGSALGARHHAKHQRPGVHQPLQSLSRRAGHRRRRARLQFRTGDGRARGSGAERFCRRRWATTGPTSRIRRSKLRGPR